MGGNPLECDHFFQSLEMLEITDIGFIEITDTGFIEITDTTLTSVKWHVFCFRSVGLHYTNAGVNPDDFKASILFKALEAAMQTDEDSLIERVRGVYAFKVRNGPNGKEGYWVVNAKTGKGSVEFNGKGMMYRSFYYGKMLFQCLSWGGGFFICLHIMYVLFIYFCLFVCLWNIHSSFILFSRR